MKSTELAHDSHLVVTAKGYGPDWEKMSQFGYQKSKLTLVKDDVPIEGRVLDLEGKPIAGVTVEVHRISKMPRGQDLGPWIKRKVEIRRRGRYLNEGGLLSLWSEALGKRPITKTDRNGRFRLSGFGRDRVVRFFIQSNEIQHVRGWAVTRNGPEKGYINTGSFPFYPAKFRHLAAPCKPIEGVVRDKKTKKPIAGVVVSADPSAHLRTTTDEKGRYRLYGVAKRERGYHVTAEGTDEVPYFGFTQFRVSDTPGLKPIQVDFELERGIPITGKVMDQSTGKPVRGTVRYQICTDNPNLKNFTTLGRARVSVVQRGRIDSEGRYTTLGLPGPGALVVLAADQNRYPILSTQRELKKLNVRSYPVDPTHAIVSINVKESHPTTHRRDFQLTPAMEILGYIRDSRGKIVEGAKILGLTKHGGPKVVPKGVFAVQGVSKENAHLILIYHEQKKLAVALEVRANKKRRLEARLQSMGGIEGKLVDKAGKPIVGHDVIATISVPRDRFVNIPLEFVNNMGFYGLFPSAWKATTARKTTTDAQGRFRVEGMIPDLKYTLAVGKNWKSERDPIQPLAKTEFKILSGKVVNLGTKTFVKRPLR